jgi:hypothetical protein
MLQEGPGELALGLGLGLRYRAGIFWVLGEVLGTE